MRLNFAAVVRLSCIGHIVCNCTFPEHAHGSWISSTDSNWTANSTHITNLPMISETTGNVIDFGGTTYPVMDFECFKIEEDTKFHLRSSEDVYLYGSVYNLYLCFDIRVISDNKLKYYKATELDRKGFRVSINPNITCLNTTLYTELYNYSLALKSGYETKSRITCPDILFGNYRYNCTDNELVSNKTSMNVCDTRQQFIFDYSVCNTTHLFSLNGTLDCVYYVNNNYNNVTYLTMYNQDSVTPDEKTYYKFTCLVIQELSNTVYLTAYPQICTDGQTPTNISSPGEALVLEPYYLCPITTESSNILPIILGVIGGLLLIATIIAIICICKRRKKRQVDEEQHLSNVSDNEEEEKDKSKKMQSSKSEKEERKSIDSGISEPGRADSEQREDERKSFEEKLLANDHDHKGKDNKEEHEHIDEEKLKIENETNNKSDVNTSNQEDNSENKSEIEKENEQKSDNNSKNENIDNNKNDNDGREQENKDEQSHKLDGDGYNKKEGGPEQEKTEEKMLIGGMATYLVGRDIGERKRMRSKQKNKKKMKKMAQKKTRKRDDNKAKQNAGLSEEITSSDDECNITTPIGPTYIKHYETKKHLEHILDEQHYWSDLDADKDDNNNENMYSDSSLNSNSDSEEDVIGSDSVTMRSRRIKELNANELNSPDLDHKEKKATYISRNLASVEDPNNVEQRKLRLNEHTLLKEYTNESDALKDDKRVSESKINIEQTELNKLATKKKSRSRVCKHKTIFVQEHSNMIEESRSSDKDGVRKRKDKHSQKTINSNSVFDFYDTDISKLSDWDSGMDDDDEVVDVILTEEQQQMIVNMLFDNEMKLRPEYGRDENGRIIRLFDNTAIYDPKTGRFIFRKRHGHLFKVPRLNRDVRGRPTGGYVDDALGPKSTEMQQENSDVNRTRRPKSTSASSTAMSASVNTNRSRGPSRDVGFDVPENDIGILLADNLEFNKRGRRDVVSALRRKLNRRLFRKTKKQAGFATPLSDVSMKSALSATGTNDMPPLAITLRSGELGPLNTRFSRVGSWIDKRLPLARDPGQLQVYKEGLASDQKILQSIQEKNYKQPKRSTARDMLADGFVHDNRQSFENERLCTKVHGPADRQNDRNTTLDGVSTEPTTPMQLEDYFTDHSNKEGDNCFSPWSSDRSHLRVIDDQRLKRLLEELYMDKKYLDHIVETTDPTSEAGSATRELAERGSKYLVRRADYWENRGPPPPRPPLTAHGWRMQNQQTMMVSRQASVLGCPATSTTPGVPATIMPGVIESPREQRDTNVDNQNINDVHSDEETSV